MSWPKRLKRFGFDITNGCQLKCVGCPNSTLDRKIRFATTSNFNLCLSNVDVTTIELLRLFNYGEPLLHPDVPGMLLQIPKQSWKVIHVEISTNGQHFDEKMLIESFKTKLLTHFCLSCDGNGTAHSYEELRPPAKWNKLIYFARKVGEIKKKYAPNLNLFTKTICVDQKEQNKWNEIMNPLGWTPKFRNWLPLPDSLRTTKKEIGKGPCRFISAGKLYVRWNGDVTLCCYHPHSAILGNLKQQKFSEIIKGKKRADILSKLHHHRDKMKVCGICQMR